MTFIMGRPKTTGGCHNKKARTYTAKQPLSKTKSKQFTLSAFLNKSKQQNNEEATTSTIITEDIESEQSEIDSESSEETASDICVTSNSSDDEATVKTTSTHTSYLTAHEIQAKWEQRYDFAIYSASNKGWFCSVCQNYGSGEYWCTKAVKLFEHPKRAFQTHAKSKQHKLAQEQKQLSKRLLVKGNVHSQMVKGRRQQVKQIKEHNRKVIIFLKKTVCFFTKKKLGSSQKI